MKTLVIVLLTALLAPSVARAQFDYAFQDKIGSIRVKQAKSCKTLSFKGADPCLSPNGKSLIYTRNTPDNSRCLILVNLTTGKEIEFRGKLTYGGRWSPSGEYLLFNEFDGSNWHICIQKSDGTSYKRLGLGYVPTWQDNQTVVFQDMKNIYVQPIEGGTPEVIEMGREMQDTVLIASSTRFYLLPSRRLIVFNAGNANAEAPVAGPNDAVFVWNREANRVETLTAYNTNAQYLSIKQDTLIFSLYQKNRAFVYKKAIDGGPLLRFTEGWDASFRTE